MARPNITPFDASPFIRAKGNLINQGIQQIGKAGAVIGSEIVRGRKATGRKKATVEEIMKAEAEHYDRMSELYPDKAPQPVPVEQQLEDPNVLQQSADQSVEPTGLEPTQSQEFTRTKISQPDRQPSPRSQHAKKKEAYLDRIRSQYASITIYYHEDSIYHSGLRVRE